ncbi:16S rRNA (uracil(1498)-N(3))-methyltransferase [Terasakiella sp. A23]|uniref:16S rRNA (uracil(1498)-N(3))-methyltransferase n=1 Tax=Terasakiella sp. FCG-A23 TaxID=3080561 RepID=UPI0029531E43|nr:16S rRNA (uracil(1498)-N(3))-methyltransferase [Terasakiella sp. A23]MDV7338200.1 16S rRNA (uracil(1498)-N(3))-methyltransferase [Terasakiella sp. A23]
MSTDIRLFTEHDLQADCLISLEADQAHYINNVMRLNVGDGLRLFNARAGEWTSEIIEARKKRCVLKVGKQVREQEETPDLWLVFAPIKKQRLDFIIEKATELGVSSLQPVITRRTIVSKIRNDRLHAQAIEASEQCERLNIPDVKDAVSLAQLVKDWPQDRRLFVLDEHGGAAPIHEALMSHKEGAHAFLTGPEGGFDATELDLLRKLPFVTPISLGPRILRADTAALAAISCWQSVIGDWQVPLRNRFGEE